MALTVFNVLRVLVIIFGGTVVGGGTVILLARIHFYRDQGLPDGIRAMWALAAVNISVMTYVALTLAEKWDHWITWRVPMAFVIFVVKAFFFRLLRNAGVEQERRLLYGE